MANSRTWNFTKHNGSAYTIYGTHLDGENNSLCQGNKAMPIKLVNEIWVIII